MAHVAATIGLVGPQPAGGAPGVELGTDHVPARREVGVVGAELHLGPAVEHGEQGGVVGRAVTTEPAHGRLLRVALEGDGAVLGLAEQPRRFVRRVHLLGQHHPALGRGQGSGRGHLGRGVGDEVGRVDPGGVGGQRGERALGPGRHRRGAGGDALVAGGGVLAAGAAQDAAGDQAGRGCGQEPEQERLGQRGAGVGRLGRHGRGGRRRGEGCTERGPHGDGVARRDRPGAHHQVTRFHLDRVAAARGAERSLVARHVAQLSGADHVGLDRLDLHVPFGADDVPRQPVTRRQGVEAVADLVAVAAGHGDVRVADADVAAGDLDLVGGVGRGHGDAGRRGEAGHDAVDAVPFAAGAEVVVDDLVDGGVAVGVDAWRPRSRTPSAPGRRRATRSGPRRPGWRRGSRPRGRRGGGERSRRHCGPEAQGAGLISRARATAAMTPTADTSRPTIQYSCTRSSRSMAANPMCISMRRPSRPESRRSCIRSSSAPRSGPAWWPRRPNRQGVGVPSVSPPPPRSPPLVVSPMVPTMRPHRPSDRGGDELTVGTQVGLATLFVAHRAEAGVLEPVVVAAAGQPVPGRGGAAETPVVHVIDL